MQTARASIHTLSRNAVSREKAYREISHEISNKRNQHLFGDCLASNPWPAVSYMQPCVPTSANLNLDPNVRVSSASVPPLGSAGVSSLAAKIQETHARRAADLARLNEETQLQTPYVYKDRATLLAFEDHRREAARNRAHFEPGERLRSGELMSMIG